MAKNRPTSRPAADDTAMADATTARRRKSYRRGHRGEWLAAAALMAKGFRILARRYRTRLGEIDLIARRGDLVLIVEVKARPTLRAAMEAIARESERRIEGAADLWLSRQPDYGRLSVRFDMVAVLPWRWPVHVENIFQGRNG
jgi:putative endonuclease